MSLARTRSVTLVGVVGHLVEVEVDMGRGLPGLTLVGLPDAALSESRDRIRAAVVNSGESWPTRRVTINLSPASLPKSGSGFDLALAVCVLAAAGELPAGHVRDLVLIGELGLDGVVRPVRGVLPAVLAAARSGARRVVVPAANAGEAAIVPGVDVIPASSLRELLDVLRGRCLPAEVAAARPAVRGAGADLSEVAGHDEARWALEVAAAGGHHLLLHGPPGSGKTMLAERLPGVLPELSKEQALEVTAIHSVAGELPIGVPLLTEPPFRAPHHTASAAAIVGGGSGLARPGAASLAHHGVLFLDEAPEFAAGVLDALRQPLESGRVVLHRSRGAVEYPARFQLVLAANPCPCGFASTAGTSPASAACTCPPMRQLRYVSRLSGPLQDRIDLTVAVLQPTRSELLEGGSGEASAAVRDRVVAARERALARWRGTPWTCNAHVPGAELRGPGRRLPAADLRPLQEGFAAGRMSARGVDRVLRLAWTLADLAGRDRPSSVDVAGAVHLRTAAVLPGMAA